MNTYIKVARYHLVQRGMFRSYLARWIVTSNFVTGPWAVLALGFALTLVIFAAGGGHASAAHPGALSIIYVAFFLCGLSSIGRSLPFGLSLGLSRRAYYLGTVLLALALAAVYGLALAMLAVIEQATGGWGMSVHMFRVVYILAGPWYLTWLTSFVVLTLVFVYGMWFGLIYRRWNRTGVSVFLVGQIIVLVAGARIAISTHAWHDIGHFFTVLTATGLTGLLAALAAALLAGGLVAIRRVTV